MNKTATDLEQSKKLAKILPIESADMAYYQWEDDGHLITSIPFVLDDTEEKEDEIVEDVEVKDIPCWSLSALLSVLPRETRLLKSATNDIFYHIDCPKENIDKWFNNPVDACVAMIEKLHELKLL